MNKRFIGVKFSVRERDLGSTIAEAQQRVKANVELPKGLYDEPDGASSKTRCVPREPYWARWCPSASLPFLCCCLLCSGNAKDASSVLVNVPFALIGGIIGLTHHGYEFRHIGGVGFIALFGICVQNGVILISVFKKTVHGHVHQRRHCPGSGFTHPPVVMTALMASIGLLPAAMSTGIGSGKRQKPLAIVIIGGPITATVLTLLVFPIIYYAFNRKEKQARVGRRE